MYRRDNGAWPFLAQMLQDCSAKIDQNRSPFESGVKHEFMVKIIEN
jgi:hypothetical protein